MSNKIDIVYILSHPLTERDFARFGIEYYLDIGLSVKIIDAFSMLYPNKDREKLQNEVENLNINIEYVRSFKEVRNSLGSYSDYFVIILYPESVNFYRMINYFNNLGVQTVCINAGVIPSPGCNENYGGRLQRIAKTYSFLDILSIFYSKVGKFIGRHVFPHQVTFFFYGGVRGKESASPSLKTAKYLHSVHALDYDLYLRKKNDGEFRHRKDKYAVLIDQNLFNDPDQYLWGDAIEISNHLKNELCKKIKYFIRIIENKYKYKVIVAAHPRANYKSDKGCYKGVEIIYNDTIGLIKNSELCILNSSTAINFAVLYKKPLIIFDDSIMKKIMGKKLSRFSAAMADALEIDKVNLDTFCMSYDISTADEDTYSKYINTYIKEHGSSKEYFWQTVLLKVNEH